MTASRHPGSHLPVAGVAYRGGDVGVRSRQRDRHTGPPKAASRQSATVDVANTGLEQIVVDSQGQTFYVFNADSGVTNACTGARPTGWTPLRALGKPSVAGGANRSLSGGQARPHDGARAPGQIRARSKQIPHARGLHRLVTAPETRP